MREELLSREDSLAARGYLEPTGRSWVSMLATVPMLATLALALSACNQSKSPEEVAKDVNSAEQRAGTEIAKSEARAQSSLDKAAGKVDDQLVNFSNDAAKQAYEVAIAKADGARKVSLAGCEAQSGDPQKLCKDQAETDYKAALADARAGAEAAKQ
jgi:hypothetical protein